MLVHHRAPRVARSSGVARRAAASLQTRREDCAISARLETVLVAAWRVRTATGLDDATDAGAVQMSLLCMFILCSGRGHGHVSLGQRNVTRGVVGHTWGGRGVGLLPPKGGTPPPVWAARPGGGVAGPGAPRRAWHCAPHRAARRAGPGAGGRPPLRRTGG